MSDNVKLRNLSIWLEISSHLRVPKCSCVQMLREGNTGKHCNWLAMQECLLNKWFVFRSK